MKTSGLLKSCILIFVVTLFCGCASEYYRLGRKHMDEKNYEEASRQFLLAYQEDSLDLNALRELGITLYYRTDYNRAIKALRHVNRYDSTDGRALFYLGASYEIQKDYKNAIGIYRQYVQVSQRSEFREQIEARLTDLIRKQMAEEAKTVLAQESVLGSEALDENTIAVLYFQNIGDKSGLDPLQKGIAEMIITDLSQVTRLKVVERIRLQKLLDEMGLGQTGLVDESTAPRVGRLLGASKLVRGAFVDLADMGLRIDGALIRTQDQASTFFDHIEDLITQLFGMEKRLVFQIIDEMGIVLTQKEREAIQVIPTESILAFLAYCRGLDYEDKGFYDKARDAYQEALKHDPKFKKANRNLKRTGTMSQGVVEVTQLENMYAQSRGRPGSTSSSSSILPESDPFSMIERPAHSPADHMIHIGTVQNQSFLPGIEAREPIQERDETSFGNETSIEIVIPLP